MYIFFNLRAPFHQRTKLYVRLRSKNASLTTFPKLNVDGRRMNVETKQNPRKRRKIVAKLIYISTSSKKLVPKM